MPTLPFSSIKQDTTVLQSLPSDSFALFVAFEVIRRKKWLKRPEANLKQIEKTIWEYKNRRIEYCFIFRAYDEIDKGHRDISIVIDLTESPEGLDGVFKAFSSSPRDKILGDCSAIVGEQGGLSGISLTMDRETYI